MIRKTYPKCKPILGTSKCLRCGHDIYANRDKACPSVEDKDTFEFEDFDEHGRDKKCPQHMRKI